MKIRTMTIRGGDEVLWKLAKEALALFKLETLKAEWRREETACDYELLEIDTAATDAKPAVVRTAARLVSRGGAERRLVQERTARCDEKPAAAARRLFKMNLYAMLREVFGEPPAPWGILHGVRPTKLAHNYLRQGLSRAAIVARLGEEYAVRADKAALLTEVAYRQLPFLRDSDARTVSVYIGIPFCLSRCLYCSFPSYVLPGPERLQAFLTALRGDMEAARRSVAAHGLKVQSIYIGGGTPTSLPEAEFAAFLQAARDAFFQPGTVEFTVEAGRPDSVSAAKIDAMCALGVNRVSVNPQTMQDRTLKHIGRNHTVCDIIELFDQFRARGRQRINMDLIIGLPGENEADMEDTIRRVTALGPDDITLHALALKKGSLLKNRSQAYALPDDATAERMYEIALRYVRAAGLSPYYLYRQGYMSGNLENIGCCRPGAEGVYNIQIMEEHQTVLGVGPAATTKVAAVGDEAMASSFHAKDLDTYLAGAARYSEKRTRLLDQAFGK